jgi:colicin import membrane protein
MTVVHPRVFQVKSKVAFIPNCAIFASAVFAIAVSLFSSPSAAAQGDANREQASPGLATSVIVERYPSGSIQSVKTADQALADVKQQRSLVEARFAEEERACYPKFFVTSCVNDAKEMRRRALVELQQIEVEANAFKRRAKVRDRDRAVAEKAPLSTSVINPARELKRNELAIPKAEAGPVQPPAKAEKPKRAGGRVSSPGRVEQHNAKLEKLKAEEAANEQKRADNVAAFEKKARDAEKRQQEIAARKAEKESRRAGQVPPTTPVPN